MAVDFRSWLRNSAILVVLMFALLILGAAVGVNIGPVEMVIWLAVLVVGLVLVGVGSRFSPSASSDQP
jgi:hypothetical protein